MTRAPASWAASAVRSTEPSSTTTISFNRVRAARQSRTTAAIVAASLWAGRMTETRGQPSVPIDSVPILATGSIALETFVDQAQGAPAGSHHRGDRRPGQCWVGFARGEATAAGELLDVPARLQHRARAP